jgi:hypothetical protein
MSTSTKDIQNHWATIRPLLTIRNGLGYLRQSSSNRAAQPARMESIGLAARAEG